MATPTANRRNEDVPAWRDNPPAGAKPRDAIRVQPVVLRERSRPKVYARTQLDSMFQRHPPLVRDFRRGRREVRHKKSNCRRPRARGRHTPCIFLSLVRFALRKLQWRNGRNISSPLPVAERWICRSVAYQATIAYQATYTKGGLF